MRFWRIYLPLSALLLALDQAVKEWARVAADGVEGRSIHALWPGVFELKLVYNHGVAFGMFQGWGVLFAPAAVVIAAGAAWYSFKRPLEPAVHHVVAALLTAGSVGNLTDRLAMGKVTDMFWLRLIDFPVFNVADVCITLAGALLVLGAVRDAVLAKKSKTSAQSCGK
jgi:signal peptidase II